MESIKIVFSTNNAHKLAEIQTITSDQITVLSLRDVEFYREIEETGTTLEENALLKATKVFDQTSLPCFADDSGLFVKALDGRPGVYSARFAGENACDADNVALLLKLLEGKSDRSAYFKTVIALKTKDHTYFYEGIIEGEISSTLMGSNGFGYDPVFIPKGYTKTFAELDSSVKNKISHRAIATQKLLNALNDSTNNLFK